MDEEETVADLLALVPEKGDTISWRGYSIENMGAFPIEGGGLSVLSMQVREPDE